MEDMVLQDTMCTARLKGYEHAGTALYERTRTLPISASLAASLPSVPEGCSAD